MKFSIRYVIDRIRNGFWILLARNYDNKQASEVQSAYFGHNTFTLYTVCAYLKDKDGNLDYFPLGVVSNEANHDRNFSFTINQIVIDTLRNRNLT